MFESTLQKGYTVKIPVFEGPFELLFHLIEKNKVSIYDIPINEITDQYLDYLFAMRELDLEIASEFLVMASTLLHIKSRMLIPSSNEKTVETDELDPREELVIKLVEYKKYKDFSEELKTREKTWEKVFYKMPEYFDAGFTDEVLELSAMELKKVYSDILLRNKNKINKNAVEITKIIQKQKISLKNKMKQIMNILTKKSFFKFSEFFSFKKTSLTNVIVGFLAILELVKLKKIVIDQDKPFSDIIIYEYGNSKNS